MWGMAQAKAGAGIESQGRPISLAKSKDGELAPCLSHQPARESSISSL